MRITLGIWRACILMESLMTSREGFSFLPPPSCSSPHCPPCPSRLLLYTRLHSSPFLPLCIVKLCFSAHPMSLASLALPVRLFWFVLPLHTGSCSFSPFSRSPSLYYHLAHFVDPAPFPDRLSPSKSPSDFPPYHLFDLPSSPPYFRAFLDSLVGFSGA